MARIIACGIDIGTNHVKVMACERVEENGRSVPKVIATGIAESRGLRHGYIVNVAEISSSISEAVAQITSVHKIAIKKAFLGIGGVGLSSIVHSATIVLSRADGEVTDLDVEKVLKSCEDSLPSHSMLNRKIIHAIPLQYRIDGAAVLGRPQGMRGNKLEVRVLFITTIEQHLNDIVEAVNMAGIDVEDVMAAPLAASLVTVNKAQKLAGCVLANIGAETASIVVFENNTPISLEVFPIGGMDITHDIALGLRIPLEEAEKVKRGKTDHSYSKRKLEDIITARLTDIFELVQTHLKKIGKNGLLPAGVILTGGGAGIASIEDIAKASLQLPARIAKHIHVQDDKNLIKDSFWSVAYGLCVFGINQESVDSFGPKYIAPLRRGMIEWFKQFLP